MNRHAQAIHQWLGRVLQQDIFVLRSLIVCGYVGWKDQVDVTAFVAIACAELEHMTKSPLKTEG